MKPVVLGIAGGTASGKSTVAAAIVDHLGDRCVHVLHDRYYRPLPAGHDGAAWNFDHPEALETDRLVRDLDTLLSGRPCRAPRYDFATHSRFADEDVIEPRPIVLVEGILVFADAELRARFDWRVFVDAPDDIRLLRRVRRDVAERGRSVDSVLNQYERSVRPMHEQFVAPGRAHAHLVLDGTAPLAASVAQVLALIGG